MKSGSPIRWDNHFEECISDNLVVDVWMDNEIQATGAIESYSSESIQGSVLIVGMGNGDRFNRQHSNFGS